MASPLIPALILVGVAVVLGVMITPILCSDATFYANSTGELNALEMHNLENVNEMLPTFFSFWPLLAFAAVAFLVVIIFVRSGR